MMKPRQHAAKSAFTLLELLVVISIIALLTTIGLAVGFKVTQSGKVNATKNIIRSLDTILTTYMSEREAGPPAFASLRRSDLNNNQNRDEGFIVPMFDGRFEQRTANPYFDRDADPGQPSTAIFLMEARGNVPNCDAMIKGLDPRFVRLPSAERPVPIWGWAGTGGALVQSSMQSGSSALIVLDAFGNPIRMGHPAFSGGYGTWYNGTAQGTPTRQVLSMVPPNKPGVNFTAANATRSFQPFAIGTRASRSISDSDEGTGIARRPYFYSAGPDGNPGTRGDNIYSDQPTFPAENKNVKND